eukprot:42043-Alexandrium_andersonii.AAC.1
MSGKRVLPRWLMCLLDAPRIFSAGVLAIPHAGRADDYQRIWDGLSPLQRPVPMSLEADAAIPPMPLQDAQASDPHAGSARASAVQGGDPGADLEADSELFDSEEFEEALQAVQAASASEARLDVPTTCAEPDSSVVDPHDLP